MPTDVDPTDADNEFPSLRHGSSARDPLDDMIGTLKQPLTAIRAAAEILRDNPTLPSELRERFCAVVIGDGDRLSRMIDSVFADARMDGEAGRICLPVKDSGERPD